MTSTVSAAARHGVAVQQRLDLPCELGFVQVARGEVHGDAQLETHRAPRGELAQGEVDDVQRDGADERGLLDQRDELQRCDHAALGVAPAQERLDAVDAPAREVELGLVEEHELATFEGRAHFAEQREARRSGLVVLW